MRIFAFPVLAVCLLTLACSPTKPFYTSLVTNLGDEKLPADLIYVKSYGQGNNEEKAKIDAEQNAFKTLLFTGVAASPQQLPIVDNETASRNGHAAFYENLLDKLGYRKFITEISDEKKGKDHGASIVAINAKINLRAFRTYLENNNIIRKFGL